MLLALDTTAATATAALFRDETLVAEREADADKKHAETVLPLIDTLLEENGVTITQIDRFAVDIGPGSFTGVRIGVSLVNALAFALGKPIVSVDSLLTLALSAEETQKPVCAMIDARNGNAYAALYHSGRTIIEPCAVEIESFCAKLPEDTILIGDVRTELKTSGLPLCGRERKRAQKPNRCIFARRRRSEPRSNPQRRHSRGNRDGSADGARGCQPCA